MNGDDVTQAPTKTSVEVGWMKDADLRRFRRTGANCFVEISVVKNHKRLRCEGRLTELSPGGGLLELDVTYPVGTSLTLRLWLPDHSDVLCTGIVRCLRDCQGLGIEFVDLSTHDLTRLRRSVEG